MAMTIRNGIDQITIDEAGIISVRQYKEVFDDDGSSLGRRFHRATLSPGEDVSAQPPRVRAIAAAVWTPAVIDAYRAARSAAMVP